MQKEFRLRKIELFNVFNYRGRHTIDFDTERPGNIFLFNIQNGGGKTSLFLAIKWGFYGRDSGIAYIKDGIPLTNRDFMNQDETSVGSFHVRIVFDYDGHTMDLRRECPNYKSDQTTLTLKVDGMMERGDVAHNHVEQIIPPDYGDFFMFNGEVLQEIANNQRDPRKTDGVLRLMGLKQLNDLKDNLSSILRAVTTELANSSGAGSQFNELTERLKEMSQKRERLEHTVSKLEQDDKDLQKRIWSLEEDRRRYADVQGTINAIQSTVVKKRKAEADRDSALEYIRNHASDSFMLFIVDDIMDLVRRNTEEKDELSAKNRLIPTTSGKYLETQKEIVIKHLSQCPVCRSSLDEAALEQIKEAMSMVSSKSIQYSENQARIREIQDQNDLLKSRLGAIPKKFDEMCTELYTQSQSVSNLEVEIKRLNDIATESDVEGVRKTSEELSSLYARKSSLDKLLFEKKNVLKNTEENLAKLRRRISDIQGLSDQQAILSNRMRFLETIIMKLNVTIGSESRRKRGSILDRANEVFMGITNKPDIYRGLEYDDQGTFAMHIMRKDGQMVLNPSSGEKHVLAISFLVSLSLNTERLSPMMMDTPLSRLDTVHKKNIANTLASLDNQVIFLAQPGEMDPETLECFKPSVAKFFESVPDEDNGACVREVNP